MEKMLLHKYSQRVKNFSFSIDYWDGTSNNYGKGTPAFKIIFNDKIPASKILKDFSLAFGEAYMDGIIDFEGDLQQIIETFYKMNVPFEKKGFRLLHKFFSDENRSTSLQKQEKDIRHHYDLGNDFYELFLDETMSYSCAYFCSPEDSLTQAQLQKVDYILKKLQLHSGESLLDIGSGWGWLIIRAAQQYGVRTLGVTLSQEQYVKTKQRIVELGLTGQVDVRLMDYRTLAETSSEKFDRVVSVGMVEHVGKANLPAYMQAVDKLLVPGGISVLHCITGPVEGPQNRWIRKYIFPGGYIPSTRELIWLLPENGFHLLDVESLRLHYAKTLECWVKNFENNVDCVREKYGERFVKMWRLYLNACAGSFRTSGVNLHQIVFSKGLNNELQLTRHYLYR